MQPLRPSQVLATWNPARGVWETTQAALCGHSERYSETWPTSGTTRGGTAYALPTLAPLTDGSGCSSLLGLLPTPDATHGRKTTRTGALLPGAVELLPTPEAKLHDSGPDYARAGRPGSGGDDLTTTIFRALLPTPAAREPGGTAQRYRQRLRNHDGRGGEFLPLGMAVQLLPTPRATDGTNGGPNQHGSSGDLMLPSSVQLLPTPRASDGPDPSSHARTWSSTDHNLHGVVREDQWGQYAPAIARWEAVTGRPAPAPTEPGSKGQPRLSPIFVEWLMGLPAGWVTDVPGISRNVQLKALGNGVVPQQAAMALRVLLERAGGTP